MKIKEVRKAVRMTQPEFARELGISRQTLGSYEKNDVFPRRIKIKVNDIINEYGLDGSDPVLRIPSQVAEKLLMNSKTALYALKENIEELEKFL